MSGTTNNDGPIQNILVLPHTIATVTSNIALACRNDLLYFAWLNESGNICLTTVATDGYGISPVYVSPQTSSQPPSLCVKQGDGTVPVMITWTGLGNNWVNIGRIQMSGNTVTGLDWVSTQPQTSAVTPSIAWLFDYLYLAWSGLGNNCLNLAVSTDGGLSFPTQSISAQYTSSQAPSLASDFAINALWLFWTDANTDQINRAAVVLLYEEETLQVGLYEPVALNETSSLGPASGALNNVISIAWKGLGDNPWLNIVTYYDGTKKYTSSQTSANAPSLAYGFESSPWMCWRGLENDVIVFANVLPPNLW